MANIENLKDKYTFSEVNVATDGGTMGFYLLDAFLLLILINIFSDYPLKFQFLPFSPYSQHCTMMFTFYFILCIHVGKTCVLIIFDYPTSELITMISQNDYLFDP